MSDTLTFQPAFIRMLETLQEVEALLAHERAYPDLPDDERWATKEADRLLMWLLAPTVDYVVQPTQIVEPLFAPEVLASSISLRLPGGYKAYGGAPVCYAPSADGTHFFGQCCDGPLNFGMYVFQQTGVNTAVMINYGPLMPGRGVLFLGGNGALYVTGSYTGQNYCTAYVVPGYTMFTAQGPMPVPITVYQAVTDEQARIWANEAKSAASSADKKASDAKAMAADAKNAALTANTTANQALQLAQQPSGITVDDLKNLLWNDPWYKGDCYGHWIAKDNIAPGVLTRLNEIAVAAVGTLPPSCGSDGALEQRVADLEQQLAALALRVTQGGIALTGIPQST